MKKNLFLLLAFTMLLVMVTKSTFGYFSDSEASTGSRFTAWEIATVTLLNDGFEVDPWDSNWDDNGTTNWGRKAYPHSGSYAAECKKNTNGYLTSDSLDASEATSITVSFWFQPDGLDTGDILVQLYNGSTYDTLYDLIEYPTFQDKEWCYFSEEITDSQYFNSDFRLRFDGSALVDSKETGHIDDVLITMEQ